MFWLIKKNIENKLWAYKLSKLSILIFFFMIFRYCIKKYEWSKNWIILKLGEKQVLENLIEVEVYSLLSDPLHQICSETLVKATNSLFSPSSACQISDSLVLLRTRVADELTLLNPGPEGSDGVWKNSRKYFAQTSADEMFLGNRGFRDLHLLVENFWPFVDIHLNDSRKR